MTRRLAALAACLTTACAASHRPPVLPGGPAESVATYRATFEDGGDRRHAKLALWAASPDRLHAELIAPVGGVRLVLDASADAACVVDVERATAFAGGTGPEALEPLVGVRISVAAAVAALLDGVAPPGLVLDREGDRGVLPATVRLSDGRRALLLERLRVESRPRDGALGTGRPPDGLPVRPLAELGAQTDVP